MIDRFLRWFDSTQFWRWISRNLVAHITFRIWGYPTFEWNRLDELKAVLKEDDGKSAFAFVSCDTMSLAALLIRGVAGSEWTHAGFVVGNDVYEMRGKGLLIHHIGYILAQVDNFALIRFPLPEDKMQLFKERLAELKQNRHQYKYDFRQRLDGSPRQLYCSELIYALLHDIVDMKEPEYILGRFAFSPDSVYLSGDVVFEHKDAR